MKLFFIKYVKCLHGNKLQKKNYSKSVIIYENTYFVSSVIIKYYNFKYWYYILFIIAFSSFI